MKSVFKTKGFIAFIAVVLVMGIAFGACFGLRKSTVSEAETTEAVSTTEAAPAKAWYELYQDCLTETIGNNADLTDDASFGLFFLDEDDTPELFVITSKTNGAGPHIYTVQNNELVDLGEIGGCYGGFGYVEKGGKIVFSNARMNSYDIMVYTLENNQLALTWEGAASYIFEEDASSTEGSENYEAHDWDYESAAIFADFQSAAGGIANAADDPDGQVIDETADNAETTDAETADTVATENITYDQFIADYNTYVPQTYISKDMSELGFGGTVNGYCLEYPLTADVVNRFFEIVVDNTSAETLASGSALTVTGTVTDYYGSYADGESNAEYAIIPDTPYIVYISGDANFPEGRLVCISEFVLHNHEGNDFTSGEKITVTGTLTTSIPYGSFPNTEFILEDAAITEETSTDEASSDAGDTAASEDTGSTEMTVAEDVTEILY